MAAGAPVYVDAAIMGLPAQREGARGSVAFIAAPNARPGAVLQVCRLVPLLKPLT